MAVLGAELLGAVLRRIRRGGDQAMLLAPFRPGSLRLIQDPGGSPPTKICDTGRPRGPRHPDIGESAFLMRYIDRLVTRATQSIEVRRTILEVRSMLRPSRALFHPRMLVETLRAAPAPKPPA